MLGKAAGRRVPCLTVSLFFFLFHFFWCARRRWEQGGRTFQFDVRLWKGADSSEAWLGNLTAPFQWFAGTFVFMGSGWSMEETQTWIQHTHVTVHGSLLNCGFIGISHALNYLRKPGLGFWMSCWFIKRKFHISSGSGGCYVLPVFYGSFMVQRQSDEFLLPVLGLCLRPVSKSKGAIVLTRDFDADLRKPGGFDAEMHLWGIVAHA